MPVYREIPLSFGTLVLVQATDSRDKAAWKASSPASLYEPLSGVNWKSEALDTVTARDPLDLSTTNMKSVAFSGTEREASIAGDALESILASSRARGSALVGDRYVMNTESAPILSPLLSPSADDAFDKDTTDPEVKIGPTTRGTATIQKPYVCEVCGRPFRRRKDIRRHLSTHSNDKPFYCWACCLTFRSREYLRRHLKRTHGQGLSSESGESGPGIPHVEQQPRSVGDPSSAEQNEMEWDQDGVRGKERGCEMSSVTERQGSLSQPSREGDVEGVDASGRSCGEAIVCGKDVMSAREANAKSNGSVQRVISPGMVTHVSASPKPSSQARPKSTDTPESKKAAGTIYLCDGCGSFMFQKSVMLMRNRQTGAANMICVLCKVCFIKKTGIICLG